MTVLEAALAASDSRPAAAKAPLPAQGQRRSSGDVEDVALVLRVAQHDRQAFEALYRRYAPRVGRYLWKVLGRPELVEEVLDDVLLVVWQKAATFLPEARFSTWVFGIAHNMARKALSRLPREQLWGDAEAAQAEESDEDDGFDLRRAEEDPEQILMRQDLRLQLERALAVLSPEQRAVVDLAFTQGFSYPEIASIVGCPVNTVKTRTFHARKRLVKALSGVELRERPQGAASAAEERAS